jgi:hypothetical protein
MAYSTGSTILDDDYNSFAGDVNATWGTGSGDEGYGQTNTISTVSPGTTITATQWATLLNRISSAASHQGTSITSITNPTVGDTISAYAALASNITAITGTNRMNAAAVGSSSTTNTDRTTSWSTSVTFTQTVAFSSANAARYFFNAGGRITFSTSRSGGTSNTTNTNMTNLCTAYGTLNWTTGTTTQTIDGGSYTGTTKTGGSGSPTISTGTGFYDFTGTPVQVCTQSASAYYGYVGLSITTNASYSGSTVTITNVFANSGGLESLDGTLRCTIGVVPPSTTYLSNTWGTPTLGGSQTGS